ncbi:MAG: hypothetical protein WBR28_17510 [Mycobacterium sp.]
MAAMLGHALLSPPRASAACPPLTHDEWEYVSLLAEGYPEDGIPGIGPSPDGSLCDLAQGGHAIAYDLRHGVTERAEANKICSHYEYLTCKEALWEVVCAEVVFAPELIAPDVRHPAV